MNFQCSVCANKNTADCMLCQNCENFEPKKQTNADRLRAMTDEELAGEWIKGEDTFWWVRCSSCGNLGYEEYNFCPYCGKRNVLKGS